MFPQVGNVELLYTFLLALLYCKIIVVSNSSTSVFGAIHIVEESRLVHLVRGHLHLFCHFLINEIIGGSTVRLKRGLVVQLVLNR